MTEKIKVSLEVAEAIEFYNRYSEILADVAKSQAGYGTNTSAVILASEYELYELATILVKGYEAVLKPEEKVLWFFNQYQDAEEFDDGVRLGVLETLNSLDIQIGGINRPKKG